MQDKTHYKAYQPGVSKYDLKDKTINRMLQTSITGNHLKNLP